MARVETHLKVTANELLTSSSYFGIMMAIKVVTLSIIIVQVFKEQVEAAQEFSPTLINSHRSATIKVWKVKVPGM